LTGDLQGFFIVKAGRGISGVEGDIGTGMFRGGVVRSYSFNIHDSKASQNVKTINKLSEF